MRNAARARVVTVNSVTKSGWTRTARRVVSRHAAEYCVRLRTRWPSESDGFHHRRRRGSLQRSVGTHAKSVIDRREGKPQRREGRNSEEVGVVESHRPKILDVLRVMWLGSRVTLRAHEAKARSSSANPSSLPRITEAARSGSDTPASLDPHAREQ